MIEKKIGGGDKNFSEMGSCLPNLMDGPLSFSVVANEVHGQEGAAPVETEA